MLTKHCSSLLAGLKPNLLHCLPSCSCCGHVCLRTFAYSVQAVLDDGRKRELQNVIQSHFKEWVVNSGNMRQVYDLARMERGDGVSTPHAI